MASAVTSTIAPSTSCAIQPAATDTEEVLQRLGWAMREQFDTLEEAFVALDENYNGEISKEEFVSVMALYRVGLTAEEAEVAQACPTAGNQTGLSGGCTRWV